MSQPSNGGSQEIPGSLPQVLPIVGKSYRLSRMPAQAGGWDRVTVVAVEAGEAGPVIRYRIPNGAVLARTLDSWNRCGLVEVKA